MLIKDADIQLEIALLRQAGRQYAPASETMNREIPAPQFEPVEVAPQSSRRGIRAPVEPIAAPHFRALGFGLPPFWYSVSHARDCIGSVKQELKRWERSIAVIHGEEVPESSETVRGLFGLTPP